MSEKKGVVVLAAKIKLQRIGAKNKPVYRVVVQDESFARNSRVIEVLGQYNPLKQPVLFEVDPEQTKAWFKKGARPTTKVRILLGKAGILPPVNLAALPKSRPKAELKKEAETAPAAPGGQPAKVAGTEVQEEQK